MIARCLFQFRPYFSASKSFTRFASSSSSSSSATTSKPSTTTTTTKKPEIQRYRILPSLPYIDGYLRDFREDRVILSTINFKGENGEKRPLQIELLDENDIGLIGQLFTDRFMTDCSLVMALNGTKDEMAPFFYDDMASKLPNKMSMLVKDDEKCIAFMVLHKIEKDDFYKCFTNGTYMEKPYIDFKDDYAEDIKNGPFSSHKANLLYTVIEVPFSQTLRFLPKDAQCLLYSKAFRIDKNYQNSDIFPELLRLMKKIGQDNGCDYGVAFSVGKESANVSLKVWKHLFTFPYEKFKENGKIVFEKLSDGAKGIVVTYSEL